MLHKLFTYIFTVVSIQHCSKIPSNMFTFKAWIRSSSYFSNLSTRYDTKANTKVAQLDEFCNR
jgi:hypothetical protein